MILIEDLLRKLNDDEIKKRLKLSYLSENVSLKATELDFSLVLNSLESIDKDKITLIKRKIENNIHITEMAKDSKALTYLAAFCFIELCSIPDDSPFCLDERSFAFEIEDHGEKCNITISFDITEWVSASIKKGSDHYIEWDNRKWTI
jgi:hypothetical protein